MPNLAFLLRFASFSADAKLGEFRWFVAWIYTSIHDMGVPPWRHGGTPIAGWFLLGTIPSRNGWWLGVPHFRKPPYKSHKITLDPIKYSARCHGFSAWILQEIFWWLDDHDLKKKTPGHRNNRGWDWCPNYWGLVFFITKTTRFVGDEFYHLFSWVMWNIAGHQSQPL